MNKRHRRRQVQLQLLHSRIPLSVWNSIPASCRGEIVALLAELLRQHAKPKADAVAHGGSDE